jgi:hypothetical protein
MLGTANGALDPRTRASLHYLDVMRNTAVAATEAEKPKPSLA